MPTYLITVRFWMSRSYCIESGEPGSTPALRPALMSNSLKGSGRSIVSSRASTLSGCRHPLQKPAQESSSSIALQPLQII